MRAPCRARAILDGEAIALRDDGAPHPFQVTMRRFGRLDVDGCATSYRCAFFFDALARRRGVDRRAGVERFERLVRTCPPLLVPRVVIADARSAAFLERSRRGHEGLVAKALSRPTMRDAGLSVAQGQVTRRSTWLSSPRSGARTAAGWLSNLHLGARDPENGGFVMLGKTFKGLTDEMLEWQTRELLGAR